MHTPAVGNVHLATSIGVEGRRAPLARIYYTKSQALRQCTLIAEHNIIQANHFKFVRCPFFSHRF
jgi:hypothetical protein